MTRAYLGLGSNVGDRLAHLRDAVRAIDGAEGVSVVAVSRVYETDPVGGPDQPAFYNAVVAIDTALDARALLDVARSLETSAGREPDPHQRVRWGPRPLDVDVLLVGDETVSDPDLEVPHPRMHERGFVLAPLADVAPDHPTVRAAAPPDGRWPGVRPLDVELMHDGSS